MKQPLVRLGVTVEYYSPGYKYLKRVFVSKEYDPDENPSDYEYIPATISDNTFLLAENENYKKQLDLLPDDVRKAFLFGDWNKEDGK
jgi:phage terminase large subunit